MTTRAAATDIACSDPTSQDGFSTSIVPAIVDYSKTARRKHRATGKPRGGRRIYSLDTQIAQDTHVYTPQLASEILRRMAAGETVAEICRSRPDFPHPR